MEKTPGSLFREAICASVTKEGKTKSFKNKKKKHCSKVWSRATVLSAKYSIWPEHVMEKHKGGSPNRPGHRVYSSVIFCESSHRAWFGLMPGQGSSRQNYSSGWVVVDFVAHPPIAPSLEVLLPLRLTLVKNSGFQRGNSWYDHRTRYRVKWGSSSLWQNIGDFWKCIIRLLHWLNGLLWWMQATGDFLISITC